MTKINIITGPIEPWEMSFTLMHEHISAVVFFPAHKRREKLLDNDGVSIQVQLLIAAYSAFLT